MSYFLGNPYIEDFLVHVLKSISNTTCYVEFYLLAIIFELKSYTFKFCQKDAIFL